MMHGRINTQLGHIILIILNGPGQFCGRQRETNTPVLIQVSMGAAKYMGGYKFVKDMVEDQMDAMEIKFQLS